MTYMVLTEPIIDLKDNILKQLSLSLHLHEVKWSVLTEYTKPFR